ncbi:hypothetical protein [Natronoglycomyces albus]|uniref:Uncharacterized protein n=1 Tax=Natronoglycomyces albus TaxID=2811108 RepID=A0A895XSM3_9ACTN|nr:hypothetical protein [Natronoglycomyces albus]QSB06503.1 hypothetical protein JQS30_06260 [Natronoglycomyces albus]
MTVIAALVAVMLSATVGYYMWPKNTNELGEKLATDLKNFQSDNGLFAEATALAARPDSTATYYLTATLQLLDEPVAKLNPTGLQESPTAIHDPDPLWEAWYSAALTEASPPSGVPVPTSTWECPDEQCELLNAVATLELHIAAGEPATTALIDSISSLLSSMESPFSWARGYQALMAANADLPAIPPAILDKEFSDIDDLVGLMDLWGWLWLVAELDAKVDAQDISIYPLDPSDANDIEIFYFVSVFALLDREVPGHEDIVTYIDSRYDPNAEAYTERIHTIGTLRETYFAASLMHAVEGTDLLFDEDTVEAIKTNIHQMLEKGDTSAAAYGAATLNLLGESDYKFTDDALGLVTETLNSPWSADMLPHLMEAVSLYYQLGGSDLPSVTIMPFDVTDEETTYYAHLAVAAAPLTTDPEATREAFLKEIDSLRDLEHLDTTGWTLREIAALHAAYGTIADINEADRALAATVEPYKQCDNAKVMLRATLDMSGCSLSATYYGMNSGLIDMHGEG